MRKKNIELHYESGNSIEERLKENNQLRHTISDIAKRIEISKNIPTYQNSIFKLTFPITSNINLNGS